MYVLGGGILSSLGVGLEAQVEALRALRPKAGRVTLTDLEEPRDYPYHALPAGAPKNLFERMDLAVAEALAAASLAPGEQRALGIFIGSTSMALSEVEEGYRAALEAGDPDPPVHLTGFGILAAHVAERFAIEGPQFVINTACNSSANALIYAARMIAGGMLSHALVVGSEHFNRISLYGFESLMLLDAESAKPFDKHRQGIELGEGVAAVVLGPAPLKSAQPPRFRFLGGESRCDPQGLTCSSGERIAEIIAATLDTTGLAPGDIAAIKAHGTSTPANDLTEGQGLRQVFADRLPPFTTLKSMLGHTLGACGAVETVSLLGCLEAGFLPATVGFSTPDEEIGCRPLTENLPVGPGRYLLNFFGFGGNNSAFVISDHPGDGAP